MDTNQDFKMQGARPKTTKIVLGDANKKEGESRYQGHRIQRSGVMNVTFRGQGNQLASSKAMQSLFERAVSTRKTSQQEECRAEENVMTDISNFFDAYAFDAVLYMLDNRALTAPQLTDLLKKAVELHEQIVKLTDIELKQSFPDEPLHNPDQVRRFRHRLLHQLDYVITPALIVQGANLALLDEKTHESLIEMNRSEASLYPVVGGDDEQRDRLKTMGIIELFLGNQPIPTIAKTEIPKCIKAEPMADEGEGPTQVRPLIPYFIGLQQSDASERTAEPFIERAMKEILNRDHGRALTYGKFVIDGQQPETLLTYAVRNNLYTLVYILLQAGVHPNVTVDGRTPKDYATNPYIHELLAQAGGRPSCEHGWSRSCRLDEVPLERISSLEFYGPNDQELSQRETGHMQMKIANECREDIMRLESDAYNQDCMITRIINTMNGTLGMASKGRLRDGDFRWYSHLLALLDQAQLDLNANNYPDQYGILTAAILTYIAKNGCRKNMTAELLRAFIIYGYTPPEDFFKRVDVVMTASRIPDETQKELRNLVGQVINREINARDKMVREGMNIASPAVRAILTFDPTNGETPSHYESALKILLKDSETIQCVSSYTATISAEDKDPASLSDTAGQIVQNKSILVAKDCTGVCNLMSRSTFDGLTGNKRVRRGQTLFKSPLNRQKVKQILETGDQNYENHLKLPKRIALITKVLLQIDPTTINEQRRQNDLDDIVENAVGDMTLKPGS